MHSSFSAARAAAARQAIIDEDVKRKITVMLPLQPPFASHQRPAQITPAAAAKSLADLP